MDEKSELDLLTNKFNSICDDTTAIVENTSTKNVPITKNRKTIFNYKKVGLTILGVYILSVFLTYYVLDPKYYQEDGKTLKRQFLFCSVCVFLFLIIYYYGFRYILKKYF